MQLHPSSPKFDGCRPAARERMHCLWVLTTAAKQTGWHSTMRSKQTVLNATTPHARFLQRLSMNTRPFNQGFCLTISKILFAKSLSLFFSSSAACPIDQDVLLRDVFRDADHNGASSPRMTVAAFLSFFSHRRHRPYSQRHLQQHQASDRPGRPCD